MLEIHMTRVVRLFAVCLPLVILPAGPSLAQSEEMNEGKKSATKVELDHSPAELVWVRIPGGTFKMGSSVIAEEKPVHKVTMPTFEMTKTEVTVSQYKACLEAGACTPPGDDSEYCNLNAPDRGNHPVNCVDWKQAQAFAKWAGGRLPSEAEWEYAARSGGRKQEYPWGNKKPTCLHAVMEDCGHDGTMPVCSRPDGNTAQGLCDMAGNVIEWVEDSWHDNYKGAPRDGSAWVSRKIYRKVTRDGAWDSSASAMRSASRGPCSPDGQGSGSGFRIVRTPR